MFWIILLTMSVQENEYQQVFLHLRSLNFHFLDTWVKECVNYYKSNNPNISLDVLKKEVEQQWLLVNLREIKVPCLPPDLKSKGKVILNGNYAVQVESMIDSSVSCYSQWKKFLEVDMGDIEFTSKTETEIKPIRCLTFVICDGVQEIKAMEYQIIKKINTNDPELLPGFKMVIKGPVECRKGMILLKDENVRVCGGEVDTLTVSNSLKSLLSKRLELDESDFSDNAPNNTPDDDKENCENQIQAVPLNNDNNIQDEGVEALLSQNDDLFLSLPPESEILPRDVQPEQHFNISESLLDENISEWKDDELKIIHDNFTTNKKKHVLPEEDAEVPKQKRLSLDVELQNEPGSSSTQNSMDCDKDIFLDDLDEDNSAVPVSTSVMKKPVQTKLSVYFRNSNSSMSGAASRGLVDHKKPVYINSEPFVYFKHLMSVVLSEPRIFTFKAIILTLKKKITIENDEYNLKASVTDGSCSVDVEFCSEVLEDLLGFSPCEMIQMLKSKQTNTAIAQRIKDSFSRAQEKLISLNCLMDIKFFPDSRCPVILSLTDVTAQHVRALKERLA